MVSNSGVKDYLKAIKFRGPRGASEGGKYLVGPAEFIQER